MTISRVKFPWPPFFRILIFFDEVFNSVRGTTYLMRDDGATVVNVRSSRVIWSSRNPTDLSVQPCKYYLCLTGRSNSGGTRVLLLLNKPYIQQIISFQKKARPNTAVLTGSW